MPYTTIDHSGDGSYSVSLYLDEIAHIVSGIRPYILLKQYDKNVETLNRLIIHHKACPMDSFHKLSDLQARILSVHKINTFFSKLFIVTLVIDAMPSEFFDFVLEKSDQLERNNSILRSSEHSIFSHLRSR